MDNIRILVCDDHAYLRDGIKSNLENVPGIFVVGEAEDGHEMIAQYESCKPDLIISDIEMPPLDGPNALKQLKLKYPDIKALFVSAHQGEDSIYEVIKAGGLGLIGKSTPKGELHYAINEVINGRQYFGQQYNGEQIAAIIEKYDTPPKDFKLDPGKVPTEIEDKVLILIGEGMTSNEIAEKLSLSRRTIDTHRQDIIRKFNLKNLNALILFAVKYLDMKQK